MANEKTPKYFYVSEKAPTRIKKNAPTKKVKSNSNRDLFNPIFNFDKSFGENFLKVKPIDVAASEPFIDIKVLNLGGKVIQDLNVAFFQKQIDFKNINGPGRYNDRPLLSLKSVEISTDLTGGSYLYISRVYISIKIHKKDQLSDRAILGLLFPGCPLLMTYGWNSKDEWLNSKQTLLLSVTSYDINIDESGQSELNVSCTAYNDAIASTIIGDLNTLETSNDNVSEKELAGLFAHYKQLDYFLNYLDQLEKTSNKNQNDYEIIKSQAVSYRNLRDRTKGAISKRYSGYINKLSEVTQDFKFGKTKTKIISFHDLVFTICDETLKAMSSLMPVANKEGAPGNFEIVYGSFNDNCYDFSGQTIADFPIDYSRFLTWLRNASFNGERTVYLKGFLDSLVREFLQNEEYIRKISFGKTEGKAYDQPDIAINFVNTGDTLTLFFTDVKSGIPPTNTQIKDLKKASTKEAENKILNGVDIPSISISNANSFVKSVTFSRVDDPNMETVLIERMINNSSYSLRDFIVNSQMEGAQNTATPLTLPLQGSMTTIGHVGWMPFRAFYLSTGIFLIDAIYKITKVTHTLSSDGFQSQIEFFWH